MKYMQLAIKRGASGEDILFDSKMPIPNNRHAPYARFSCQSLNTSFEISRFSNRVVTGVIRGLGRLWELPFKLRWDSVANELLLFIYNNILRMELI